MIKYKYRHKNKIIVLIIGLGITLAAGLAINKLKPVNAFEVERGNVRVTTSQRMALINVEPDNELKQEVFDNWDNLNWGDRALYSYRLNLSDEYWFFINEKFEEEQDINYEINRIVNSILAVDSLFKRFQVVGDSYVLEDKIEAIDYYCNIIDTSYTKLKELGYNKGEFESARLNWLNATYPALQDGIMNSHSRTKKEGAYNNFTSQLYYWEKMLYGE